MAAYVGGLSTRARFDQFAVDYRFPFAFRGDGDIDVQLSLADAMDFLTRKDYTDNWLSETQEQFCGLEFADWKALLADVGFELDPASPHDPQRLDHRQPARPGRRAAHARTARRWTGRSPTSCSWPGAR